MNKMNWNKLCVCGYALTENDLYQHKTEKGTRLTIELAYKCPECYQFEIEEGAKVDTWLRVFERCRLNGENNGKSNTDI